jgi:hypothetical protein
MLIQQTQIYAQELQRHVVAMFQKVPVIHTLELGAVGLSVHPVQAQVLLINQPVKIKELNVHGSLFHVQDKTTQIILHVMDKMIYMAEIAIGILQRVHHIQMRELVKLQMDVIGRLKIVQTLMVNRKEPVKEILGALG